jgi:hypothetical protein
MHLTGKPHSATVHEIGIKSAVGIITVIFAFAFAGCSDSPGEVLVALEKAARAGDAVAFGSYFTAESRPFAETLLRVQKEARAGEAAPVEKFSTSNVISESVKGGYAVVTAGYQDGSRAEIIFRREGGKWKLDAAATDSGSIPGNEGAR